MAKKTGQTGMGRHLSRKLIPLAAGIALLIAVLAPVTFLTIENRNLQHMATLHAEYLAEQFRRVAQESPALWRYQTYKFIAISEGFHPSIDVDGFRILDEKGEPISGFEHKGEWIKQGGKLTFTEELGLTLGSAPIMLNNRRVGTVEVLVCDIRLLRTSAFLFCFSTLIGIALAVLVYRFPVRVVRKMEGEIEDLIATVRHSEEKYRSLVENIPDVTWTVDSEGNSIFASPNVGEVLGYTPEEFHAAGPSLWFDNIHPDDRDRVKKAVERLFAGGAEFDEEYRYRRKDGAWVWLHDRATGTYEREGKKCADGIFSEITGRKRMEEALRNATEFSRIVMDSIEDAISIVDVNDYRIIGCNAGYLKKFGIAMGDVVGKHCYELTHHRDEPCCPPFDICPMKETVATGKHAEAEHTHFLATGEKFFAEVSTTPVFNENGMVVKVVHVDRDITGRKRSEEDIRRLNEELELKVEEKTRELVDAQEELVRKEKLSILGQLSGSVGHELRNPLGVMSNAVYFLQMVLAEADETTKEYLGIIMREIDNSQRIITDLLDFARTRAPQTRMVMVSELVEQCLDRCAVPENVTLLVEIPESLPRAKVDPLQMGQVLTNLITNAVQAMPAGGRVRIGARLVGAGLASAQSGYPQGAPLQDFVEISVADTGEGISPDNMKKLFQPLFTTKAKGIGLGLVVCRNLIEANGGRIEVESRPGEGTTLTVTVPIAEQGAANA